MKYFSKKYLMWHRFSTQNFLFTNKDSVSYFSFSAKQSTYKFILQIWPILSFLDTLLLCISTSKRVLHTPFAGQNQFFDAKTLLA